MSRIASIFGSLREDGRRALMPFVCGGYPGPGDTCRALGALQRAGASVVEVGFPFSDPIADGPAIAAAMHEALGKGATPASVLEEIRAARADGVTGIGVVAMVSVSIVWRVGAEKFIKDAKAAGVDGFIFPDVPVEEAGDLTARARDAGLTASLLVAPTTGPERAERIVKACSGFVYLLARAGITGEGGTVAAGAIRERVRALRELTDLPIACGFGIGTSADVRAVVKEAGADAAIVGSALVRRMGEAAAGGKDAAEAAGAFARELAMGLT